MIDFIATEATVRALKKQAKSGEIDLATFEAELMKMVDAAEDGYYWMFGHVTEQWYRHDGQNWLPDSPGELLVTPNELLNHPTHHQPEPAPADWASIEMSWFLLGVVSLIVIFSIVYAATLQTTI